MSTSIDDARTDTLPFAKHAVRPAIPRFIRRFAVPIILGWIAIIAVLNVIVPQLDKVGQMRSVSMSPDDAQSVIATKHVGEVFGEYKSNSSVMIVLEGQNPLGNDAHAYYDQTVRKLDADTKHVEHGQDMWSDPLTGSGAQSNDAKAAYVQVYLAGNQGEALANESVEAVQKIVNGVPAPNGVKAYVTGPAALTADQHLAGDRSLQVITTVTFVVIIAMLLMVYRSIITVLLTLVMVVFELSAARGMVAFLGYYTMFGGTAHVVLGSGMTIAGATFCLHFTNLPYFQTLGIPLAIGMVVVVAAALTLGPAVISVASRFRKTLEPKRAQRIRGWRKVGALVVRWPGPILIVTIGVALVGLLTLPGYRTNYTDRNYLPADLPANAGYAAADRHFSQARMNPEVLVIEKIAKTIFRVPGIGRVQAITRPEGTPIEHTSIPFQISMQGVTQQMNQKYQEDQMADMLKQADMMQTTIDSMVKMQSLTQQMADTTHGMVRKMHDMTMDVAELRDHIS